MVQGRFAKHTTFYLLFLPAGSRLLVLFLHVKRRGQYDDPPSLFQPGFLAPSTFDPVTTQPTSWELLFHWQVTGKKKLGENSALNLLFPDYRISI